MKRPVTVVARVVRTMNSPGKNVSHQALAMKSRPIDSMVPHSGAGGRAPRPRKLSAEAQTMAWPTPMVMVTTSGRMALGSSWRSTIREVGWPSARAASM